MWTEPTAEEDTPLLTVLIGGAVAVCVLALFATGGVWLCYRHATAPDGIAAGAADFERSSGSSAELPSVVGIETMGGHTPGCLSEAPLRMRTGGLSIERVVVERSRRDPASDKSAELVR
ncbi:MAG: hypothetical protein QM496_14015 [Verrucomicrobiota bacterium]